jgi:uncharacterized membrane protein YgcG
MLSWRRMRGPTAFLIAACTLLIFATAPLQAQRQLSWDTLDVDARLDTDGVLHVVERHAMLFTGDWNGGERAFNLRPRQHLDFERIERLDGGNAVVLTEDSSLDDVDDYAFTDRKTLRWRSRLPSDPSFVQTRLAYALHYRLSGILQKDGDRYLLDHDFAFPNRDGAIERFTLRLALDPDWEPLSAIQDAYTAGPIPPGSSYVRRIAMRYTGTGVPAARDGSRPREVVAAVAAIPIALVLGIFVFFRREDGLGRFAPLDTRGIDAGWIESNLLVHPAEVVGAAWDESVGAPEVVALLARMVGEGKLESELNDAREMTLTLKVDPARLDGYERALVDKLFFDGRTRVNTEEVKEHYKGVGFDPANVIKSGVTDRVNAALPPGTAPSWWWPGPLLFLMGAGLLAYSAYTYDEVELVAFITIFAFVALGIITTVMGLSFRGRVDWGRERAIWFLIPSVLVSLGTTWFLWSIVGSGMLDLPPLLIAAIALLAICLSNSAINSLKTQQGAAAIAFRKRLASARRFFEGELAKPDPALRDRWYPWVMAFGLGEQVDRWSTQHRSSTDHSWRSSSSSSSTSSSSSSSTGWTGGGGMSGGAGASATWAAAAAGMAAGVASPSSSSSGSSSGGSSGGGGGGGW